MSFIDALNDWVNSMTDTELCDSYQKSNEIVITKMEIENKISDILRKHGNNLSR